jgi:hypothetical protein
VQLPNLPLERIDWPEIEPTTHPGERGSAVARTFQAGDIRLRLVTYSPGYVADHWCVKGHLVLVIAGCLRLELKDRAAVDLGQGQGLTIADDDVPHRAVSDAGATLFLVD